MVLLWHSKGIVSIWITGIGNKDFTQRNTEKDKDTKKEKRGLL